MSLKHIEFGTRIQRSFGSLDPDGNISFQTLRDKQELRRIIRQPNASEILGISSEEVQIIKAFYEKEEL